MSATEDRTEGGQELPWVIAPPARKMLGEEAFEGLDATVRDFWAFALGDLRMNTTRGWLAEFLVAKAVGAEANRIEWDAFDVRSPAGIRIEVKSAAYLQAWDQRKLSPIKFGGLASKKWTAQGGPADEATYGADVYVFAVLTATDHSLLDPLHTAQWDFYVVPQRVLEVRGTRSIALSEVKKLAPSTRFVELSAAITAAASRDSD